MVRTQIYLTEAQRQTRQSLAVQTGRKQSELIREAIDRYVASTEATDYRTLVGRGARLWRERSDLPDFEARIYMEGLAVGTHPQPQPCVSAASVAELYAGVLESRTE